MDKHRINMMSLRKSNISNKSVLTNNEFSSGPYYILPMIDKNLINTAYQESTSVLSKYISTQAKSFNIEAQSFKLPDTRSLNKSKKYKKFSPEKNSPNLYKSSTKTEENVISNKSSKNINFYLTAKDIKNNSSELKPDNSEEKNQNEQINLTEANNINNNIKIEKAKKFDSSISIDRIINKNQFKVLNSTFHRIRTYQPKIPLNWKFSNGISVANNKVNALIPEDIEYQSKIFNDQYKLLSENYQYYKMKIVPNDDFINAFSSLNLKNKIEFNKTLEEICGLLIILPRHLLAEFFKYVEYLKAPSKSSFKDKYIFDEVGCLYENNKLLHETFEFFQNSFEIYILLVKEVDGIALKPKEFEKTLSIFERIRFDISFVCNISENALIDYTKEIGMVYKLNKYESEQNKLNNITYALKLKNYQIQSKNKERQRKLKIDECLQEYNYDNHKNNKNIKGSRKFKSIMDTKMVSRLLSHCRKEVKYNIITERLNNEFDWNINNTGKVKNKPIKINF